MRHADVGNLHRDVVSGTEHAAMTAQRDEWIRAFNRLSAAINHHDRDSPPQFRSDADERLHRAHQKIIDQLATGDV